jgi:histidine triad (HIT) family protein
MNEPDCLFCKIASGEIDANIALQNERVVAFHDINPQAPTHVLIVPRRHIATINDLREDDHEDIGALFLAARDIAKKEGFSSAGYRVTMNCNGAAGQTVFHLHLHLLGGRNFSWPPG